MMPHYKAEAKARQSAAGGPNPGRESAYARNGMSGQTPGPAREAAARAVGVSASKSKPGPRRTKRAKRFRGIIVVRCAECSPRRLAA